MCGDAPMPSITPCTLAERLCAEFPRKRENFRLEEPALKTRIGPVEDRRVSSSLGSTSSMFVHCLSRHERSRARLGEGGPGGRGRTYGKSHPLVCSVVQMNAQLRAA